MIEVNTETDFVAKNEMFQEFVKGCLKAILNEKPADVADLLSKPYGGGMTVDEALKDQVLQIKENITIRRFVTASGELSNYIHNKGAIGVIVKVDANEKAAAYEGFAEFRKNLTLQIASMGPVYISRADVPASAIEEEKARIIEEIKEDEANAKKPENVIEKMVYGKINKYYNNSCLLEQEYVKEEKMSVGEYIENYNKQSGGEAKVTEFYRYAKGEGIAKREDDFAAEIAQLTANK
jgi:elongation factor Ts